ncbi:MAG: mechanosensitive ion channel [Rhodobacteraceae bacterium]|nr:mechanosensitive ion channel [Paracoccaceae bacterium]
MSKPGFDPALTWLVRLILALTMAFSLWQSPAIAQSSGTNTAETGTSGGEPDATFVSPVVIDGVSIFSVRGTTALPADKRAENVQNQLLAIAEASEETSVKVEFEPGELGFRILADGQLVSITTNADAEYEKVDLFVLASIQSKAVEKAILDYRAGRTDEARVHSAYVVLAWTVGFAAMTLILLRLRKSIPRRVERFVEAKFSDVQTATKDVVKSHAVAALARYFVQFFILIIIFASFYYYLSLILLSFAETKPFAQLLITYVTSPVFNILKGFVAFIPNMITIGIVVAMTRGLIKGSFIFFQNIEAGTISIKNFEKHWIWPTYNIVRVTLMLIAAIICFPFIPGAESEAVKGLTLLVGVMVSLGSNSVVSNVLAGLFVIYRRSMNIGDRIRVGEHVGDVVKIKLMETYIKSIKNELISIPNGQILNSDVINYSSKIDGRGLLLHTTVGIGYEEPRAKVEAMLIEAAKRTPNLKNSPTPFVLCSALADYAVNYQINAYTTRGSIMPKITSDLHSNIIDVFNENGVQIMTPSYIADTDIPKIPPQEWDGELAIPKKR